MAVETYQRPVTDHCQSTDDTRSPGCHPVSSMLELRVYPPGQRQATYAAFSMEACSHAGPVYLNVTPVQAGVGTRNG